MKKLLEEIKTRTDYENIEKMFGVGLVIKNTKQVLYQTLRKSHVITVKKTKGKCSFLCLSALKWSSLLPIVDESKIPVFTNGTDTYPKNVKNAFTIETEETDLKAHYDKYVSDAKEILEAFEIESVVYSEVTLARIIAYKTLKYFSKTSSVQDDEHKLLDDCCIGACVASVKGTHDDVYDYDVNSFYPWIMSNTEFMFPLDEYEETDDFTKEDGSLDIVKCDVKGSHAYFKKTANGYYDTYQRETMDLLGIKYSIDKTAPRYLYRDCVKSKLIFSDSFEKLYELKKNGNKLAKKVLNCTWGILSKYSAFEKNVDDCDGTETIIGFNTARNTVQIAPHGRQRMYTTARIKNFVLSYGRLQIMKQIKHVEELGYNVFKVDTDGFISDIPPNMLKLGSDMGELKHVKTFKRCVIKNARNCKEE